METDKNEGGTAGSSGVAEDAGTNGEEFVEEMVMETPEVGGEDADTVTITFSDMGLADHLRTLGKRKTVIQTQAQEQNEGLRRRNDKSLRDLTNKIEIRPTVAKTSRPAMKVTRAQQSKELKILKRPREVWRAEQFNGPPNKRPFDKSISVRLNQESGSGKGRPPEPPDINILRERPSDPLASTHQTEIGERNVEIRAGEEQGSKGDVSMEEAITSTGRVEEVLSTQS